MDSLTYTETVQSISTMMIGLKKTFIKKEGKTSMKSDNM